MHSGELYLNEVDLVIPGRGFDWRFERKYRSGIDSDGLLGHNWEFNYNRRLFLGDDGNVLLINGGGDDDLLYGGGGEDVLQGGAGRDEFVYGGGDDDDLNDFDPGGDDLGRNDLYELQLDGSYTSPAGFYTELFQNVDNTFTERGRYGNAVDYDTAGRMTSITDRNDNVMQFQYDVLGRLTQVIDTLGRPIDYTYDANGRLTQVTDFSGRVIDFGHDANGDLVSVTSPAVTGTPNGNDFPTGKTTLYSYQSGSGERLLDHNLLTVTAPNEEAVAGPPRLQVVYDTNPASADFDRVLTLTVDGTNASGVLAGGDITYSYSILNPTPADNFSVPFSQTTVTDRNGNITEYDFNSLGNVLAVREQTNRDIRAGDPVSFDTTYAYNADGEVLSVIAPQLNSVQYVYDSLNSERRSQGNLLSVQALPDGVRGGDQTDLTTTYVYDPIYNLVRTVTDPRGNDTSFMPPIGTQSAPRYTTTYTFDYEEGCDFAAIGAKVGRTAGEVTTLLNDAGMCAGPPVDDNGDGVTDQVNGNVIRTVAPEVNLLADSKQFVIEGSLQPVEEVFTYNQFGQLIKDVDPEANVHTFDYYPEEDPDGDGFVTILGKDPTTGGYLKQTVLDTVGATPTNITTTYEYDDVGNVTRVINPRGVRTDYDVNQLNQVVRVTRAADVTGAFANPEEPNWVACLASAPECTDGMVAFLYLRQYEYDANNNLVRVQIEDRGDTSGVGGDNGAVPYVDIEYEYDILDRRILVREEVSDSEDLITRYRYDRNENLVLELSPAANLPLLDPDLQAGNVVSQVFDERDLLFTSTRGGSTDQFDALPANADIVDFDPVSDTLDISDIFADYDANGNLSEVTDAEDTDGFGGPETTTFLYDGFDRLQSVVDPVGNQSFLRYDPASNAVVLRRYGPVGGATPNSNSAAVLAQPLTPASFLAFPAGQSLLNETTYEYDELNRLYRSKDKLFDYQPDGVTYVRLPVLADGPLVETRYEYDRFGRLTHVTEDDADTVTYEYDGMNRLIRLIDPETNEVRTEYDDNSNVVRVTEEEHSSGGSPPLTETFVTTYAYDSLDRLIRTIDPIGETSRVEYDSRDNVVRSSDPQTLTLIPDPLGIFPTNINDLGNTTLYVYDGLSRRTAVVRELRVDGQGSGLIAPTAANPDGLIVTDYDWDANSRQVQVADDGSSASDQNTSIGVIEPVDPLGNVTTYAYDSLDRRILETFDDLTTNAYVYDADDNNTQMTDENGSVFNHTYDGINRPVRLDITPAAGIVGTTLQTFEYDGLSRVRLVTDNNDPGTVTDDSTVTYAYDSLSRLLEEDQNGQVISSQWAGDNNRLALIYPDLRVIEYAYDTLDRVVEVRDAAEPLPAPPTATYDYIGPTRLLERTYGNDIRLTYRDLGAGSGYDPDRRIVRQQHINASTLPAVTSIAEFLYTHDRMDNILTEERTHRADGDVYTYDSAYRVVNFDRDVPSVGGPPASTSTYDLDGPGNWTNRATANKMNEYDLFDGSPRLYDDNGNLTDDGNLSYVYDAFNRLRRVIANGDNCPQDVNPDQLDADGDGLGFACDLDDGIPQPDIDGDNVPNEGGFDNCPQVFNPGQEDVDFDGVGVLCDPPGGFELDIDSDGITNRGVRDNCPQDFNPTQQDSDSDGLGDACDPFPPNTDQDADLVSNLGGQDNCPFTPNPAPQSDSDEDGVGDACDPDPAVFVPDLDGDTIPNAADLVVTLPDTDALGRRLSRIVYNSGPLNDNFLYAYDGASEIQSDGIVQGQQQYVRSNVFAVWVTMGFFEVDPSPTVRLDRSAFPGQPLFYQEDAKGNSAALTDEAGLVQERYTYDAYGVIRFEDPFSTPTGVLASPHGNPFLFDGQRYEPEMEVYCDMASSGGGWCSYYKPDEGRSISRGIKSRGGHEVRFEDKKGLEQIFVNSYAYAGNNPASGPTLPIQPDFEGIDDDIIDDIIADAYITVGSTGSGGGGGGTIRVSGGGGGGGRSGGGGGGGGVILDEAFEGSTGGGRLSIGESYGGPYGSGSWVAIEYKGQAAYVYGKYDTVVDLGDPADAFGGEVTGNGSRVNQGAYGNTAEASRSMPPRVQFSWGSGLSFRGIVESLNVTYTQIRPTRDRFSFFPCGTGCVTPPYAPGTTWFGFSAEVQPFPLPAPMETIPSKK